MPGKKTHCDAADKLASVRGPSGAFRAIETSDLMVTTCQQPCPMEDGLGQDILPSSQQSTPSWGGSHAARATSMFLLGVPGTNARALPAMRPAIRMVRACMLMTTMEERIEDEVDGQLQERIKVDKERPNGSASKSPQKMKRISEAEER